MSYLLELFLHLHSLNSWDNFLNQRSTSPKLLDLQYQLSAALEAVNNHKVVALLQREFLIRIDLLIKTSQKLFVSQ